MIWYFSVALSDVVQCHSIRVILCSKLLGQVRFRSHVIEVPRGCFHRSVVLFETSLGIAEIWHWQVEED